MHILTEKALSLLMISLVLLTMTDCRRSGEATENSDDKADTYSWTAREKDILYHMSLPAQMTRIFENRNFPFQPELPNNPDNIGAYSTPFKIAANLGVYGADLGYVRILEQDLETARYLKVIYTLTEELDIPQEIYADILGNLDKFMEDPDELAVQLDFVFHSVNSYLRESDRDYLTAAILLGGWIESLHLASSIWMLSPENFNLLERIAEQKYSLNFLINHLNNFQEYEQLLQYNLMLKNLKRSYEDINIYYFEGDVSVDTVSKTITAKEYQIETTQTAVMEIATKVETIRSRLTK